MPIDLSQLITAEMKAQQALDQLVEQFRAAIQSHVDQTARSRDYHDAVTLASYDTESQPRADWRADASAFVVWRTEVWTFVYAELDKATAVPPQRAVPTIEEFIAELPAIVWPEATA